MLYCGLLDIDVQVHLQQWVVGCREVTLSAHEEEQDVCRHRAISISDSGRLLGLSEAEKMSQFNSPGLVLFEMSAGLDVAGQLNLHVAKQRDHLELL